MRRVGCWGVMAALVVGLGAAVRAANEPNGDPRSAPDKSWWSGWFGDKPAPKAKAAAEKKTPEADRPAPPRAAETAAFEQQKQMKAYLRRLEVCMRLRQIADQTGDADLLRQVDALDTRAWEVYRQQTARLPVPASTLEEATKSDEKTPARRPTIAAKGSVRGGDDMALPAAKAMSRRSGADSLGGAFDQRERDLINGTFMGGNRP